MSPRRPCNAAKKGQRKRVDRKNYHHDEEGWLEGVPSLSVFRERARKACAVGEGRNNESKRGSSDRANTKGVSSAMSQSR